MFINLFGVKIKKIKKLTRTSLGAGIRNIYERNHDNRSRSWVVTDGHSDQMPKARPKTNTRFAKSIKLWIVPLQLFG